MNICIFPGSFNPIHTGHISMAEYALEKYSFDKVIFVPAYLPPHKEISESLALHRYNMVKLAISMNSKFEVSDFEYKSGGKSYSIFTVKHFIDKYRLENKINFIIGTDAFLKIDSWYKPEELKKSVHFIVFRRHGSEDSTLYEKFKNNGWDFELTDNDFYDVSSTQIRNNSLNSGISSKVEEYIKDNGLYKN